MKIKYLGTGGSEGIPASFCVCPVCENARKAGGKEVRRRASALINDEILVDLSPDFFSQALELHLDLSRLRALLITHTHYDHFYLRELTNRAVAPEHLMGPAVLDILGSEEAEECLHRDVAGKNRDVLYRVIDFTVLKPFVPFEYGEYTITPLKARHNCVEPFIFIIEEGGKRMLYGNDTAFFPEETWDYMQGIYFDFVSLDCSNFTALETDEHMCLEDNLTTKKRMYQLGNANEKTRFFATHFSHLAAASHYEIDETMRIYGIRPVYDGLEITF
ncbi:hypothetical protein LJC34_01870 [Oscillospiraceae bacterium OttesenSCG-928-G22]|nr:hypothetical protein [Oscillospiraceae bacterium OttesenSCG-928-G22]